MQEISCVLKDLIVRVCGIFCLSTTDNAKLNAAVNVLYVGSSPAACTYRDVPVLPIGEYYYLSPYGSGPHPWPKLRYRHVVISS